MLQYKQVRQLYSQVPILSPKRIASVLKVSEKELREFCLNNFIASQEDYTYRTKFTSYSLEGTPMPRCKFCGIKAFNYCEDCVKEYEVSNKIDNWFYQMNIEGWKKVKKGWRNYKRGLFLKDKYTLFFYENAITP